MEVNMTKRQREARRAEATKQTTAREKESEILRPQEELANQTVDALAMQEREERHKIEIAFTQEKQLAKTKTVAREFVEEVIANTLKKRPQEDTGQTVQNPQKQKHVDPLKKAAQETSRRVRFFAERDAKQAIEDRKAATAAHSKTQSHGSSPEDFVDLGETNTAQRRFNQ